MSSRTEGTPIVLFEAIAAGIPLVATLVGGVPDVVGEQDALLVVSNEAKLLREPRIAPWIQRGGPIVEVPLEKNGRGAGVLYARWVYGYRGP